MWCTWVAICSSAKPKSAWQIETELRQAADYQKGTSSAKPKSAWQIETAQPRQQRRSRSRSAKPKSAWQIETARNNAVVNVRAHVQPNPNLPGRLKQLYANGASPADAVQPNPNLPGRLKPCLHLICIKRGPIVQPNPNLPGRLKHRYGNRIDPWDIRSAKPKSAWQIETGSSVRP